MLKKLLLLLIIVGLVGTVSAMEQPKKPLKGILKTGNARNHTRKTVTFAPTEREEAVFSAADITTVFKTGKYSNDIKNSLFAFTLNDQLLVVTTDKIYLINSKTASYQEYCLPMHIQSAELLDDGRLIVSNEKEKAVLTLKTRTLEKLELPYSMKFIKKRFKNTIFVSGAQGPVQVIDLATNQCIETIDIKNKIYDLAFMGKWLYTRQTASMVKKNILALGTRGGKIQINAYEHGENIKRTFKAHAGAVSCIEKCENILISAGEDKKVKVWNMQTGLLKTIEMNDAITFIKYIDNAILIGTKNKICIFEIENTGAQKYKKIKSESIQWSAHAEGTTSGCLVS